MAEYWLVDPAAETVCIHCPREGALMVARTFGRGEVLRSPLLEGFALAADDIFSRLRRGT